MKLRITHVIPVYAPAFKFGGPVLSVSRLCEGLAKKGHQVRVITTNTGLPELPKYQLGKPIMRGGVEVTYFPIDHIKGPIRSKELKNALHNELRDIDLLHLSTVWHPLGIGVQREASNLST